MCGSTIFAHGTIHTVQFSKQTTINAHSFGSGKFYFYNCPSWYGTIYKYTLFNNIQYVLLAP